MKKKISSVYIGTRLEALLALDDLTIVSDVITFKNTHIHKSINSNKFNIIIADKMSRNELFKLIYNLKSEIIFSSGFKYILPKKILNSGSIFINSHPSMLPKYKGSKAILDAFNAKEEYVGCSLHYMNEKVDSGEIIFQDKIDIRRLSLEKIYESIFSDLEPRVIRKGLKILFQKIKNNN